MILPKEYLSWSQIWLWENNKDEYIRTYIKGEEGMPANDLMIYGIEYEKKLDQNQLTLKAEIEEVKILGKPDYYDQEKNYIQEHKTGLSKWTQERVNDSGQLKMYAILAYAQTGKYPTIELLSFNHGDLPSTFIFEINEKKIDNFKKKIVKIAKEIESEFIKYLL